MPRRQARQARKEAKDVDVGRNRILPEGQCGHGRRRIVAQPRDLL